MKKIFILFLICSFAFACHPSCNCDEGGHVCLTCKLDFIGSVVDSIERSCPCPPGWYTTVDYSDDAYSGCEYNYGNGEYSGGCYNNCKDFGTLEEAKVACNLDPSCKAITYSFKAVGGSLSTNAITGFNHGYQLRASATGSVYLPNKENSWFKGTCPDPNLPYNPCDFQPKQGTYLAGCDQNCLDFPTLALAQVACRADPNCGGITFSRKEIGGSAATNAFDGNWGFQLRSGTVLIDSPNGENSWRKISCDTCLYDDANGEYSAGCVENCKDFATLDEAKAACNADPSCKAITYSFAAVGGSQSTNAIAGFNHGYQLRGSATGSVYKPNKENTWLKGQCPCVDVNNSPCDFEVSQGTYLAACDQNCKDYPTLALAEAACRADANCGGVTFSRAEIGGSASTNAFDGVWGFQLRTGNIFINSPNGENSWRKVPCPTASFSCTRLINTDGDGDNVAIELDACKLEIGLKTHLIVVETSCCFEVDKVGADNLSYVLSTVTLNINQCSFSPCCLAEIVTLVQYLCPSTHVYVDLPSIYFTKGPNGEVDIKIPLINIYDFSTSTQVNPTQIVQEVDLQIFIGDCDNFVRVHQWKLYVYTNRDEIQVFNIDVDIQTTTGCNTGEGCIVVADLDTISEVVTDDTFSCVKPKPYCYEVGDHFYARIKFADPTYTKKLTFVNLYLKNDSNCVFDFTGITTAVWVSPYLEICLPLVEPTISAVIQIDMVIDPARRMRALQTTTDAQTAKVQFTATVAGNSASTPIASASESASSTEQIKGSSALKLILSLNLLSFLLLLL